MGYKFLGIMLGCCLIACETVDAIEPASSACANSECVVFVNDKAPAAEALCDGAGVTIRWTAGENVFLTTCEDAGTAEQNTNFLSDAAGNHASKLAYGRPVLKQFVRQHPAGPVPDKFAPRPYCTPPSLPRVETSAFVLLDKLPAKTENGYCFEPTYVHYDNGQVAIDTAKARIGVSDKNYYGTPPSAQQRSDLAALIHQYAFLSLATPDAVKAQTQSSPREHTLCDDREEVYFSCPLDNGKTVSVCARNNTGPNRGYVQYRYGTKDDTFVFPAQNVSPAKAAAITDVSEGSIRGLHLKFSRGSYTYVVSSVSPGEVYVVKDGKVLFDDHCNASIYKNFSSEIFDGVNEVPMSKVDIH